MSFKKDKFVKGTVSVISSELQCKYGNDRFTTIPKKVLTDQVWIRYQSLQFWEFDIKFVKELSFCHKL